MVKMDFASNRWVKKRLSSMYTRLLSNGWAGMATVPRSGAGPGVGGGGSRRGCSLQHQGGNAGWPRRGVMWKYNNYKITINSMYKM